MKKIEIAKYSCLNSKREINIAAIAIDKDTMAIIIFLMKLHSFVFYFRRVLKLS